MQTILRLLQLPPEQAAALVADPGSLAATVASARVYSDVYRYWHAIEYLLAQHLPGGVAARWLTLGTQVSLGSPEVPGARVLSPDQVRALNTELDAVQPDDLIAHYDSAALDEAGIYPATWQEWEQEFDPLGQALEHYSFLQEFMATRAREGSAALLYFDLLAEGSV